MMRIRIGCDTGGTFTDLVAFDEKTGRMSFHKASSTPDDPSRSIVEGIRQINEPLGGDPDAVSLLVHGTTVATNTVLQRAGGRVALVTTAGFRDVLHIQRQDRPRLYDLRSRRAKPLVPRRFRFELNERILFDGSVRTPVDAEQLDDLIDQLRELKVDAVAVGFLHSYANPAHETEVGQALRKALPDVTICLSHEVVCEHGEYERFSTCVMNAFVQPVMQKYLSRLEDRLHEASFKAPLFVMKSNGGVMSAASAGQHCVETILSGPCGGVVAGVSMAGLHDQANLITADMGGTSFDVSVIQDGRPAFARDSEMGGLALAVPMLDIHTVGAGGGSIAWIDSGGSMRVGPQSAGADPGPACYSRGGEHPTVTDANLLLGRLSPTSLLGGGMTVDVEAARRAIHDKVAGPSGLSVQIAAEGIIRVVNSTMTTAIRRLTVERGLDPRDFVLCPFGGAGPLHGAELAAEMGIKQCLVPIAPGVTSAIGLLMSDLREDRVRTHVRLLEDNALPELEAIFQELIEDAGTRLGFADAPRRVHRSLGMRYRGQRYELTVSVAEGPLAIARLRDDFHREHERMYGYAREDEPVEVSSIWSSVEADLEAVTLPKLEAEKCDPEPFAQRSVFFSGIEQDTPVYRRDALGPGVTLSGPAVIEQLDATTLLWPNQPLTVDDHGQLVLGEMK